MIDITIDGIVARISLDRPEVHNAFDGPLVGAVTSAFEDVASRPDLRVVVLSGNGKTFCAGGDLRWMQRMIDASFEDNLADAAAMAKMFQTIATCPKPVIARVHGAALGGGAGLAAACDLAIALDSVSFGFTEVRLGIVPAVIAPFVVERIGPARAREYMTTGERFSAAVAQAMGLAHMVVPDLEALDRAIQTKVDFIGSAAPGAVENTKALISQVASSGRAAALERSIRVLAEARTGREGQAGMKAFLAREQPPWVRS